MRQFLWRVCLAFILALFGMEAPAWAAFGVVNAGGVLTVDSGAGLVFKVSGASGDISSIVLRGVELQSPLKRSHLSSGLGSATVSATTYGTTTVKITVSTPTLTHYYMVRNGQNTIFMATCIAQQPSVGELRWITRLKTEVVTQSPTPSDLRGTLGPIESGDVFGLSNGQSRSKYYGNERALDLKVRGATGNGLGVWIHYGPRESSSGGPFFRDIQNQTGDQQEVYNYLNSGHNQTEAIRTGVLYGPYALIFTDGSRPAETLDTHWIHSLGLNLQGWVQHRGLVKGKASGIPAGFEGVVGFSSAVSQGWCKVDAATANFQSPWLKPGTYTQTLYKGELAVASKSVTVAASSNPVLSDIASSEQSAFSRFRIGEWDGTPKGFQNADKINGMHPSDSRMTAWAPTVFNAASDAWVKFPAYQWKDKNNPTTIKFWMQSDQIAPHTLKVGITAAFAGARPQIKVNGWSSPIPASSSQPNSRSLTLGTYRGNNHTFSYAIPASALVAGENTISLILVSGSSGTAFLSPGVSYDCVELVAPYNGTFRISPQSASSLALTASSGDIGTPITLSAYADHVSKQFRLDAQSDGSYRVRSLQSGGRVVGVHQSGTWNGTWTTLGDDAATSAQRFRIVPVGDGQWVRITPVLDATKALQALGNANGSNVGIWDFGAASNQLWKLTPVWPAAPVSGASA